MSARWVGLVLAFVLVALAGPGEAHRPYFTQTEDLGDGLRLRLLHGDGLIGPDPVRAIIVDEDGILLALSPLSVSLRLVCDGSEGQRSCVAYDAVTPRVFEIDRAALQVWHRIETDDPRIAAAYPEFIRAEFGFTARAPTVFEIATFTMRAIAGNPLGSLVAVCWATLIALVWSGLVWRIWYGKVRFGWGRRCLGCWLCASW
ncbi:MAG: hypothetical protein AAFY59_19200 [Pseudomonadota bacterium]